MVLLFYTTYISEDLAHHEIFHAKDGHGKGGIKDLFLRKAYLTFEPICTTVHIFANSAYEWSMHLKNESLALYHVYQLIMKIIVMCKVYTDVGGIK